MSRASRLAPGVHLLACAFWASEQPALLAEIFGPVAAAPFYRLSCPAAALAFPSK
jgi:hypothetical protein